MNEQSKVRFLLCLHDRACQISLHVFNEMMNSARSVEDQYDATVSLKYRRETEDETINLMCRVMELEK